MIGNGAGVGGGGGAGAGAGVGTVEGSCTSGVSELLSPPAPPHEVSKVKKTALRGKHACDRCFNGSVFQTVAVGTKSGVSSDKFLVVRRKS